jgi:hypothetical protein
MSLQPGNGYTFKTSADGFSLDVEKPWTAPLGDGVFVGVKFPDVPQPPDIPEVPGISSPALTEALNPHQFQCRVVAMPVSGIPTPVIQVAMGSVTYTQSLMPFIKFGAFTDHRQAYINFVAVKSSSVTPAPLADATSPWMLGGGGYSLAGTGRWFVTLSKWDAGNGAFEGGLLDQNLPWVSLVKDGSAEFDALFVDTGPSLYENQTNIQKMEGYQDVVAEGETLLDWGHCHTTYFNPRFFGNHVRILAVIDSIAAVPMTATMTTLREGSTENGNEIKLLTFAGQYKSGQVTFMYNAVTTGTSFNPSTQNAYDLQVCLNTIPALTGNVFVQPAGPGVYQIEFTNSLRNVNVADLVVNSTLTSFDAWYKVSQMHVGSQDIVIPCELNATFLMNKAGVTEAEDPYYINEATTPPWGNVSNIEAATAANALGFIPAWATPIFNETVPRTFDRPPHKYAELAGCTGDDPMPSFHPFLVMLDTETETERTFSIVSGTVNNLVPNNIDDPITVGLSAYFVYLKLPYVSGVYPSAGTDFSWNVSATMPTDTDAFAYVKVADINPDGSVSQYVTGSLWSDRIKMGTQTARYYHARI